MDSIPQDTHNTLLHQATNAHGRLVAHTENVLEEEKLHKKLGVVKTNKQSPSKVGSWTITLQKGNGGTPPPPAPIDNGISRTTAVFTTNSLREISTVLKKDPPPNPLLKSHNTRRERTLPILEYTPTTPSPSVPTPTSPTTRNTQLPPLRKQVAPTLDTEVVGDELPESSDNEELTKFFPIDLFDDTSFETKTPEQWLQNGPVKAVSKWFSNTGLWTWAPCTVVSYNAKDSKYLIEWEGGKRKLVSRLNLMFNGEDKDNFEKRLESSLQFRLMCETFLRRTTRVSKKDLESMPTLPNEVVGRVLRMVGYTPPSVTTDKIDTLTDEVMYQYQIANKAIEFDAKYPISAELPPQILARWALPPKDISRGTVSSPGNYPFTTNLAAIERSLPCANINILNALLALWAHISEIREIGLWNLTKQACPLFRFIEDQQTHFQECIAHIKREIQPNLGGIIMSATNDEAKVGREQEQIRYFKLLHLVNQMQKDALRDSLDLAVVQYTDRLAAYKESVADFAPHKQMEVIGNDVPSWVVASNKLPPLFSISLVVQDGRLAYSPPLYEFESALPGLIRSMAEACLTLPALEVATIDAHYYQEMLAPISLEDATLRVANDSASRSLQQNSAALLAYCENLKEYEELLSIDVVQYMATFAQKNRTLASFKFEVEKNQRYQESIQKKIADEVAIGMFMIDCRSVKECLAKTGMRIRAESLQLLRDQAHEELSKLISRFVEIKDKLSAAPKNPKELADMCEYLEVVSSEQVVLQQRINNVMKIYQVLEDFSYSISQQEFAEKYELFGWPLVIKRKISEIDKINQVERLRMIRDLRANQKALETKVYQLAEQAAELDAFHNLDAAITVGDRAKSIQGELTEADHLAATYRQHEKLFDFPGSSAQTPQLPSSFISTTLPQLLRDFEPMHLLWTTGSDWLITHSTWLSAPFPSLNADTMAKTVNHCVRVAQSMVKTFKNKKEGPHAMAVQLKDKTAEFKELMPLIAKLRHPGIRRRHWEAIATELSFRLPSEEEFTLGYVLQLHLEQHADAINKLTDVAINEYALETALEKMAQELRARSFVLCASRDSYTLDLAVADDINAALEDQLVMLQTMQSSPFIGPFLQRTRAWKTTLQTITDILVEWLSVQKGWLYLAPIFISPDINRQLPAEGRKYSAVDSTWRKIMSMVAVNPKLMVVVEYDKLLQQLQDCSKLLEQIMKGLNDYLEIKRAAFARFYFLSNEELVDILAQNGDPKAVQPHLRKCFENVVLLKLQSPEDKPTELAIKAMISAEGEAVPLCDDVATHGKDVETWLLEFEGTMKRTIKKLLIRALAAQSKVTREQWISLLTSVAVLCWVGLGLRAWPSQVILAANQIIFTQLVTRAIQNYRNPSEEFEIIHSRIIGQLESLSAMLRANKKGNGTDKDNELNRLTATALLMHDVHNRDVVANLIHNNVTAISDWNWQGQLRYYLDDEKCIVRMVQASFDYGYEYIGNTGRLISTPLTDRAYRSLATALSMNLGAALMGPAGTGKTETVKDLAKAVAKQCIVFNCSAGLDVRALTKIFRGVASTGTWVCFDEFNRMEVSVLSVVAQHVLTIQQAVGEKSDKFNFDTAANVRLDRSCAIFVTMNPGYAGRSELPDNLQSLFRPVTMVVPDFMFIAEIHLFAEGFQDAPVLARKLVTCFRHATEQLSKQDHYDFGLRAIKTVLTVAGRLVRRKSKRNEADLVAVYESQLLAHALRECSVSKLVPSEILVHLFGEENSHLVPSPESTADVESLSEALHSVLQKKELQAATHMVLKCMQLYQALSTRIGVMLVGEPFSGKSTAYRLLADALDTLGKPVEVYVVHPKALTMEQLYGTTSQNLEWTDGLLSHLVRQFARDDSTTTSKWIIFDGPIDPLWIESMNTVLDDNRTLCLTNGERISIPNNVSIIAETSDLSSASPNTISRFGMVHMDADAIGWQPILKSWLNKQRPDVSAVLSRLLPDLIVDSLAIVDRCGQPLFSTPAQLVKSFVNVLGCFLAHAGKNVPDLATVGSDQSLIDSENGDAGLFSSEDHNVSRSLWQRHALYLESVSIIPPENSQDHDLLESMVLFSVVWSIGATLDNSGRIAFDAFLRDRLKQRGSKAVPFPADGLVFDYYIDWSGGAWRLWVAGFEEPPGYVEPVAPTSDMVSRAYLMEMLIRHGHPVLLCGETGVGKTCEITQFIFQGLDQSYVPLPLSLSRTTSSGFLMDRLEANLEKRKSKRIGVPLGKKIVVFVDNLHTPETEEFGSRPPIEFLRQYLSSGGWYDRKDQVFREIETENITLLGAMTLTRGTHTYEPRFTRYFNVIYCNEPQDTTLTQILVHLMKSTLTKFARAVQDAVPSVIAATLRVYRTLSQALVPTTSKLHYIFTLLDVYKIFRQFFAVGNSQQPLAQITSRRQLIKWWLHEVFRVFGDRMIDTKDEELLWKISMDTCNETLHTPWIDAHNAQQNRSVPKLLWADVGMGTSISSYEELSSIDKLVLAARNCLHEYNLQNPNRAMDLYLFSSSVEHVVRILRTLRQTRGHSLLLGYGGSGRQSLARLAAHIAGYEVYELPPTHCPDRDEWREDLKRLLRTAGLQMRPIVLLISYGRASSFLEDIHNLVHSGSIPDLFTPEEVEAITASMRSIATAERVARVQVGTEYLYARFIAHVRAYLHVVLCMNPVDEAFAQTMRTYPAFIIDCTVNYFSPWPVEALKSIAEQVLSGIKLGVVSVDPLAKACVSMHQSVIRASEICTRETRRYNYVNSSKYLELLSVFQSLLTKKRNENEALTARLVSGLEKLNSVSDTVSEVQQNLTITVPILESTTQETDRLMEELTAKRNEAEATRLFVQDEEKRAADSAAEAKAIAESAEAQLAEALPSLQSAIKAVNKLSRKDITEVRSFVNPPAGMTVVIDALCILFGRKPRKVDGPRPGIRVDDYWPEGRVLLNDSHFLQHLTDFDKDNISEEAILKLKPYINNPHFVPSAVEKISVACKSLCSWIRAIENYYWVSKSVAPKKKRLEEAQIMLQETLDQLEVSRARLKEAEASIELLSEHYNVAEERKNQLIEKVEGCHKKLSRAHKLIGGLGGERARWESMVADLAKYSDLMLGDALLSASSVVYMGPFPTQYRAGLLSEWVGFLADAGISHSDSFSLSSVLGDPMRIRSWHLSGLLHDTQSTENAIVMSESRQWPLIIDPQGLAVKWIRTTEKDCVVTAFHQPDFRRVLENAIRFGQSLLIEISNNELDVVLDNVLTKRTFSLDGVLSITVGDNTVPYNDNFRLFIVCKHHNPHFPAEVCTKINLVNFGITQSGLEDELLTIVVNEERKELEHQREQLENLIVSDKKTLKEMEDKILQLLYTAEGNLLEDEVLIDTLAASKKTSNDIKVRLEEAMVTERTINDVRIRYQPVAERAAVLYQVVADLSSVNIMYQFSLDYLIDLFVSSIADSPLDTQSDIPLRVGVLNENFTYSVYTHMCASILEKHKLLFAFMLAAKLHSGTSPIENAEWRFLISGYGSNTSLSDSIAGFNKPDSLSWLGDTYWQNACHLENTIVRFKGFTSSFVEYLQSWSDYMESTTPHLTSLPGEWESSLSPFQKLLVLRALRPDRITDGVQLFVKQQLGQKYLEPPPFDLETSFADSGPTKPLIFLLSQGDDPTEMILEFAQRRDMHKRIYTLSLGQHQGPVAERQLLVAIDRGSWVLLQNCHLAAQWLPTIEKLVTEVPQGRVHPQFRLWLTSTPHPSFPVSLLRAGVKVCAQSPKGVRGNLLRAFMRIDKQVWDSRVIFSPSPSPPVVSSTPSSITPSTQPQIQVTVGGYVWPKLVYGLCFFHALVQERGKYGPLGWNQAYKFSDSDLAISMRQLEALLFSGSITEKSTVTIFGSQAKIPGLEALRYMISEIHYGGRVTDEWDKRCLRNILADILNEESLVPRYKYTLAAIYGGPPEPDNIPVIMNSIQQLPINDDPEVFGLNENAEIVCAQKEANALFDTIGMQILAQNGIPDYHKDEEASKTVADILSHLPYLLPTPAPTEEHTGLYGILRMETQKYNTLLDSIRTSLQHFANAQLGLVALSAEMESLKNDLLANIVPTSWLQHSYPTMKSLAAYLRDLSSRVTFIRQWIDEGEPKVFWLAGLFSPQSLITGLLQKYSALHKVPIDMVALSCTVHDDSPLLEDNGDVCFISGIFMEGSRWNTTSQTMEEEVPKEMYSKMPQLRITISSTPQQTTTNPQSLSPFTYQCPLYNTVARAGPLTPLGVSTNYITSVTLLSHKPEHHWIKRGTALFCQLPIDL